MTCLVLLPGMDGTGLLFAEFTAALSNAIKPRVIAYPPQQTLDYAQLEAFVRERLPVDERLVLLGESFSAPIAIAIAANPPRNLVAAILCCSFPKNPRPALAGLKPFTNVAPLNSATLAAPFLLGGYATPVLRRQLAEALARVSPAVMRARLRAVIDIDVTENLQRVRVPLLYLRASRDRLVPEASARLIAALTPQTETVVVDGPHMLLQTAPVIAANLVGQFIARTDP